MTWLIRQFGSKKLTALVATILAGILVPVLNQSLKLNLDTGTVQAALAAIVGAFIAYVAAQAHVDASTGGQTTTAYQLTQAAAVAAASALPPHTIGAQVAAAVVAELRKAEATVAIPVVVPPTAPQP